jgi:hypothetical protein
VINKKLNGIPVPGMDFIKTQFYAEVIAWLERNEDISRKDAKVTKTQRENVLDFASLPPLRLCVNLYA